MKKFLKITAIVLLVIIAAMVIIPFAFKGKIVELVKTEINNSVNAKVDFQGFSLSLFSSFPDFNFGINGLSVVGIDKFESDTLAYIDNLHLVLDLGSVISGDSYEIKSISIDKPYINVKILKDGSTNYDIAKEDTTAVDTSTNESGTFHMSLQKFKIKDAKIVYDDHDGDMTAILEGADFLMKGDLTESTTELNLISTIESFSFFMENISYMKRSKLDFEAKIGADLDKFLFTFKENKLKINNLTLLFDGWVAMPDDDISMDITYSAPKADFKTLLSLVPAIYLTDMEGLKASGKAAFSGFVKGIYNDELMPAFGVKMNIENGNFQYPDLPQAVEDVQVNAEIISPSSDFDKITIDVSKFHFNIAKNPMDIVINLSTPISDPNVDAKFEGKFNLADVGKFYPLDEGMLVNGLLDMNVKLKGKQSSIDKGKYAEFQSEGYLKLKDMNYSDKDMPDGVSISNAEMEFNPRYIALTAFNATYLKNTIAADGKLTNYIDYAFGDGTLGGNLTLKSEYLNLDELLASDDTSATLPEDTSAMEAFMVPENIDFTLNAFVGRIKYDNININSLYGKIRVAETRVNMEDLNMELLGGSLNLNGFYSTIDQDKPSVSMVLGINSFDIKSSYDAFNTVKILAPISKYISGNFSSLMTYNSEMDLAMNPVYSSLDAYGLIKTSALSIQGSPSFSKIASELKYDKLNNLKANPMMIDFTITDGNLEVKPFDVVIDQIPAHVSGTANINRTVNYKMAMEIPSSKLGASATSMINNLQSQAKSAGVNLGNTETIPVNIFINGPGNNPDVKVAVTNPAQDLQDQLENIVKDEIKKVQVQAKEEIEKKKQELLDEGEKLKKQAQDSINAVLEKQKLELEKKKAELEQQKKEAEDKAKKKLEEEAKKKLKKFF